MLFDLTSSKVHQGSLLDLSLVDRDLKREKLMSSLDSVNDRYGHGTVRFALESASSESWHMKQKRRSPNYFKDWNKLPLAFCGNPESNRALSKSAKGS